jgi:hypothetical protein
MHRRFWFSAALVTALGSLAVSAAPRNVKRRPAKPARKTAPAKPAAAKPTTRAMTLAEARTAVAMLDDAYSLILEETHAIYHTRPSTPVAATVVRKLQTRMTELGWPRSRFLAVNAVVMHPDHVPRDAFEKQSVDALRRGDERTEQVSDGKLRVTSVVSLGGGCGSCHWATTGQSPKAATTFTIPLKPDQEPSNEIKVR